MNGDAEGRGGGSAAGRTWQAPSLPTKAARGPGESTWDVPGRDAPSGRSRRRETGGAASSQRLRAEAALPRAPGVTAAVTERGDCPKAAPSPVPRAP